MYCDNFYKSKAFGTQVCVYILPRGEKQLLALINLGSVSKLIKIHHSTGRKNVLSFPHNCIHSVDFRQCRQSSPSSCVSKKKKKDFMIHISIIDSSWRFFIFCLGKQKDATVYSCQPQPQNTKPWHSCVCVSVIAFKCLLHVGWWNISRAHAVILSQPDTQRRAKKCWIFVLMHE